jgi:hypothetical protein
VAAGALFCFAGGLGEGAAVCGDTSCFMLVWLLEMLARALAKTGFWRRVDADGGDGIEMMLRPRILSGLAIFGCRR